MRPESRTTPAGPPESETRLKACSWLAAHYRHQSLDLPDLADADKFYEGAATNCPLDRDFTPEVYPLIRVLDDKGRAVSDQNPVRLKTDHRRGQVSLELRLGKPRRRRSVQGGAERDPTR